MRFLPLRLLLLCLPLWAQQQPQPFILNVPIRALAQDTSKPVPIIWVATPNGVFKSSDTGLDWINVYIRPAGQPQPSVRFIHIDAADPKRVYLASNLDAGGVFLTTDAGATWRAINKGLPAAATVDNFVPIPSAPLTFYLRAANRIYKTEDGGENWTLRGTLPFNTASAFDVNRTTPALMFATLSNAVYRSRDEGATWNLGQVINAGTVSSLLVDPLDATIVYLTIVGARSDRPGFYRSTDGGEIFSLFGTLNVDRFVPNRLVADPTGRTIYAGYDEEAIVYRSTDKGFNWSGTAILPSGGFSTIALDPNEPRNVLAGTAVGLFRSDTGGLTWRDGRGPVKPTLAIPQVPLEFTLSEGVSGRLQVPLRVVETTAWTLPISATVEGAGWLRLDGSVVNTPSTPNLIIETRGLPRGEHTAAIRVDAPLSANAPVRIPVKLTVVGPPSESRSHRIATFAGSGQRGNFGDNQPAIRAFFGDIDSVAADLEGNVYVTDPASSVVRRIGSDGIITRFAGNGRRGDAGDGSSALLAQLDIPQGIAVDRGSNVYVCDSGAAKIRRIARDGGITTLASSVGPCRGVAVDVDNNVYVTVPAAHVVLRVSPDGRVSLFAGAIGVAGATGDGGSPLNARLSNPLDVAVDARNRVLIADAGNHRIRRVENNVIGTAVGSGGFGYQGEGADATKLALSAPGGVAVDPAGNIYIAETENHRIRRVTPEGAISTLAGTGVRGFSGDNGPAVSALIAGPQDVAVDQNGVVFSAEAGNLRIRRLTPPPPAPVPQISEGPVNAIDGSARLAPGTLFRVTGTELAGETFARADGAAWFTDLGGVEARLNGQLLPLGRVSPTEVTGLIPHRAALGDGTFVLSRDGAASREIAVTLTPSAPTLILSEPGRALAANQDGSANSAANPGAPESLLRVFVTGAGAVEQGEEGKLVLAVVVQFAEVTIEPVAARLVAGRPGIAEIQFRLPVNQPGDYPVTVQIGDSSSGSGVVSLGPAQ